MVEEILKERVFERVRWDNGVVETVDGAMICEVGNNVVGGRTNEGAIIVGGLTGVGRCSCTDVLLTT